MTRAPRAPWWRPRTLRRQLVVGLSVVVTVVVLVVGVVTVLSFRNYVNAINDAEVTESLDALDHSFTRYRRGESTHHGDIAHVMLEFTGQNAGNIIAVLHNGDVIGSAVFYEDDPRPAPPDVVAAIKAQPWHDDQQRTVTLGSLGSIPGRQPKRRSRRPPRRRGFTGAGKPHYHPSNHQRHNTFGGRAISNGGPDHSGGRIRPAPLRRVAATAAEVAGTPLIGDDHRITARVQLQDIDPDNEVGIVAHTLNRLLDNVDSALVYRAESDRRMRQFLTDASHELRTPLAAIQGYSELTRQDSAALPPTTEYALARIESEAQRMMFARRRAVAALAPGRRRGSAHRRRRLGRPRPRCGERRGGGRTTDRWVKHLPDEPVWVRGDRDRLHQLVSNLLTNGWVHTPPGVTVTTGIACRRSENGEPYAELTVANDGPDIDPDFLPHLFERFVRAKNSPSDGSGNGLGLAIVASIVKAHEGSVHRRIRQRPNQFPGARAHR